MKKITIVEEVVENIDQAPLVQGSVLDSKIPKTNLAETQPVLSVNNHFTLNHQSVCHGLNVEYDANSWYYSLHNSELNDVTITDIREKAVVPDIYMEELDDTADMGALVL